MSTYRERRSTSYYIVDMLVVSLNKDGGQKYIKNKICTDKTNTGRYIDDTNMYIILLNPVSG
jgi:hypothetical protein